MSKEEKKVPRKLRGKDVIMVDEQILRWREKLRKQNISIGKQTAGKEERARKYKKWKAAKNDPTKIKFFD